jgi:glucose-1-phosphate thymidylyltransferase
MWGAACWSPAFTRLIGEFIAEAGYDGKEIVLGDVFDRAIEVGMTVKGLPFRDGRYIDIGTTAELNTALKQFHL